MTHLKLSRPTLPRRLPLPPLPQCLLPNLQSTLVTQANTLPPAHSPTLTLSLRPSIWACTCRTLTYHIPPMPQALALPPTCLLPNPRSTPSSKLCPPEGRCHRPASLTRELCLSAAWRQRPPLLSRSALHSTARHIWEDCTVHTIHTSSSVDTRWE